ncbi:hydantoinase/oxoprolinase family protein [Paraburkholderia heleia]|uniref:hydantoinase/oxoprolinase family protein n=1 Tax=Paraburkholderia heleia TaxID=634127 RepID=UPI0031E09E37
MKKQKTARVGIDIGGTFTDFVFHDEVRGITRTGKRLTTPDDPSRAIVEGLERLLAETSTTAGQVQTIVHGTTLITNTVLERTGARVGLLTTEGFRDVIQMGRESRYDVDALFLEPVATLVPRKLRLGVRGRLRADGAEHEPLDEESVGIAVRRLVEEYQIESLAISFLHSYRNPVHERRALDIVRGLYPHLYVTLSSSVAAEIREFPRTTTACVNAYVQPRVHGYLDRLSGALASTGFSGDLYIMLSSGGITTIEEAKQYPVRLIESGPAAGAMAAAYMARKMDERQMISFDMGGTTAKMCLIEDGQPNLKHDFEAGRLRRFMQGSGLPLKVTVVDMIEIGSGGGSIARIDDLGLMKVGPRSASSVPGPVCYRRGGLEPTVTDADLYLGCLNPGNFLGGELALSIEPVRRAIDTRIATPLNTGVHVAARGIQEIVNESMAAATRMHLAEKGKDPRSHSMFAFGGAGPVHSYALAKLLNVRRLIVPMGAGVFSAFGFLVAPPAVDAVRGYVSQIDAVDWEHVNSIYAQMMSECETLLLQAGGKAEDIAYQWSADMRYVGQGFEISVDIPHGPLDSGNVEAIRRSFGESYASQFDRVVKDVPIEAVNWRLMARLPGQDISLAYRAGVSDAQRGMRKIYFSGFGDVDAIVYDRYALNPGVQISGPAVIEERESSCSIGPDASFTVDSHFNLIIEIDYPGARLTEVEA